MKTAEKTLSFSGPLALICEKFIAQKHALGYKYNTEAYYMTIFDEMSKSFELFNNVLTKEIINIWISKKSYEKDKSVSNRACFIRQFALFMVQMGYEAYVLPPQRLFKSSFVPYIFTKEELYNMWCTIDTIKPNANSPLKHLIYPVLFRILYGCGLRINEALHLMVKNIDLVNGIITIKQAKFNKERLVPMSESLTQICKKYSNKVLITASDNDFFFPAPDKGFLDSGAIYNNFRELLWKSGISHGGRGKGPRIHDLRHTFAVNSLNKWASEGKDIYTLLPILSTYLGHSTYIGTQKYLRLTAEVYPDIIKAFENQFADAIPEVKI